MKQSYNKFPILAASAVMLCTFGVLASNQPAAAAAQKKKASATTYKQVQAIFNKNCTKCHHGAEPPAKMNLENYKGTMKGNDHGSVISAGHPDKSLLFSLLTTTGKKLMPPGKPLSKTDIASVSSWIKAGAKNN